MYNHSDIWCNLNGIPPCLKKKVSHNLNTENSLAKSTVTVTETVTVLMPQNKDDRLCPIGSSNMCMEHLNPNNNCLWQYPLQTIDPNKPDVWFRLQHMDKICCVNSFMMSSLPIIQALHKALNLSYWGNCAHKNMFCYIRNHVSNSSQMCLAHYQRTQIKTKLYMGNVISQSIVHDMSWRCHYCFWKKEITTAKRTGYGKWTKHVSYITSYTTTTSSLPASIKQSKCLQCNSTIVVYT